jgi:hypothetical protein
MLRAAAIETYPKRILYLKSINVGRKGSNSTVTAQYTLTRAREIRYGDIGGK